MMIRRSELMELLAVERATPCVSIYMPMQRRFPEQARNEVRFRNLLKHLEEGEGRTDSPPPGDAVLASLRTLSDRREMWSHPQEGLAVFAAPGFLRTYRLPRAVPERLVVANRFHVKPLLRMVQSADRYHVLALNRERIRLLEGNRDALEEVDLAPGVPRTIEAALGAELTEPQTQACSYGPGPAGGARGRRGTGTGPNAGGDHHGQGAQKNEPDVDIERFFRAVDRAILEHHGRPSGLPLILAALAEHHAPFRRLSHNRHLLEEGIETDPDALTDDELRERAWPCMEPVYLQRLQLLTDRYGAARGANRGDDALPQVALAAVVGRVDVLLLERDRQVAGSMDPGTGVLQIADTADAPAAGDVLDDLAEAVLRNGGEVIIVPSERMPSRTGLAAIYRY
ncbi:MAG TPA: hypothetical protein VFN64_01235 [Burkholderiaceae bacterium]|nr:hypothetical protein [Burkholderiaceae bacterium]